MLKCLDDVLKITKELVKVPSVVNTSGEKDMATSIHHMLEAFPYFVANPEHLVLARTVDDEIERYNVIAFVQGTKKVSTDTVILMGHLDTVGIDDYAQLKNVACNPEALETAYKSEKLPAIVEQHLNSDKWLFGRGVLDMKGGLASHIYLLKHYSEHPETLAGNLLLIAECDEEDSSHGILSALKVLKQWKESYRFRYIAAINADFVSPRYDGDKNRYIYKGTVGKLLPSFFITGKETHVGSCFEGLDPNFLAAELTREINYNPFLSDKAYGETPAPPVSLKQTDLKPSYTVQTALSAYVYYNFFIYSWSPKDVLDKLKHHAEIAFERALETFIERYKAYCELSGETYQPIPWDVRVFTYEEFHQQLIDQNGETYTKHMKEFTDDLLTDATLDIRMFSARVVEEAWKFMKDKSPAMILFYSSLYSPRIELTGKTEQEKRLIEALEGAVAKIQPNYPNPIVTRNFFPYISDMSFVALSDDEAGIQAVCLNNPAWGTKHYVEYQDVRDINVPVICIGPYGLDAHKKHERAEIAYSFEIVPNLINEVIQDILK
ncbi:M20/M25/M40 family metallo-hydrolase [Desulfosporosinus sp. Sb-LF]|uniref:M20/M25/M40 family metallo-hydrolase n=1 Tax=Desulfosporosinus sp. Sb-LF TaxID=2560027 RepID=UPI00107F5AA7|nr:M20/M25/M40 family metallo-hydrolase [Desulfosporosinus sp. Sb-LF]TGE32114.1 M20/M25/M40 family metallo-hydrolase [Desulfosporosinus sp. Sb-LF]